MTIKEVKEMFKNEFAQIEIYVSISGKGHEPNHFHTDNCTYVDEDISEQTECLLWELMDKEDYEHSILANYGESADEYWESIDLYADERILCIMIEKKI